jgi:hypothetical protein
MPVVARSRDPGCGDFGQAVSPSWPKWTSASSPRANAPCADEMATSANGPRVRRSRSPGQQTRLPRRPLAPSRLIGKVSDGGSRNPELTTRKGPATQAEQQARAGVRPRSRTSSHPAATPESRGRGTHPRRCCLSGIGACPRRRGEDTRRYGRLPVPGRAPPNSRMAVLSACSRCCRHCACGG